METAVKSRKPVLGVLLAAVLTFSIQAAAATPAEADSCWQIDSIRMGCNYGGDSVGANSYRWFSAPGGNNLRQWFRNEVADAYGGTVPKCVGYKAEGSGVNTLLACAYGTFSAEIGNPRGWIFIANAASGPRVLYGQGRHWIPNA